MKGLCLLPPLLIPSSPLFSGYTSCRVRRHGA